MYSKEREGKKGNESDVQRKEGGKYPATCLPRYSTIRVSTVVTSQR